MPLYRRIPKFGFKNPNRVEYHALNIGELELMAEKYKLESIDPQVLRDHGLVSKNDLIKILGRGELNKKLEVKAHAFSASAVKAIEEKGGTVVKL